MDKKCQKCNNLFIITEEDQVFYDKISVPAPTFCPDCRLKRRIVFRNERTLYKRNCDLCKKDIASIYHKDAPVVVYCEKCWWSDKWDSMEYGRNYDFNRPFFEQFKELWSVVPRAGMEQESLTLINCYYCNDCWEAKNLYYCTTTGDRSENCSYCSATLNTKDSMDCFWVFDGEKIYESIDSYKSYNVYFSKYVDNCLDSYFLYDCRNSMYCFGSVGLRNKKYHIFNKPYSKEEYFKKLKKFDLGSFSNLEKIKQKFKEYKLTFPNKYAFILNSVNVSGNNIRNSKNCENCFELARGVEDSKYIIYAQYLRNSYDLYNAGTNTELCYELTSAVVNINRVKFSYSVLDSTNIEYCNLIQNSNFIFGSIGLRKKQYCILNKQYTKEEYEKLVPKIIKHMG